MRPHPRIPRRRSPFTTTVQIPQTQQRHYCGFAPCPYEGVFSVHSDIGGYFGHICSAHADQLNREMERQMEENAERYLLVKENND